MKKINVRIADSTELRDRAYNYFSESIFKAYGNYPSKLDSSMDIIYAESEGVILGTVGIYLEKPGELLPHQKLFEIDRMSIPITYRGKKMSFISRWTSTENSIGLLLSYYGGKYILSKGITVGSCILKPKVARYLNLLSRGAWSVVNEAVLKRESIKNSDLNYFLTKPHPQVYFGDVDKHVMSLSSHEVIFSMKDKVNINF